MRSWYSAIARFASVLICVPWCLWFGSGCGGGSQRVRAIQTDVQQRAIRTLIESGRYADAQSRAEELLRSIWDFQGIPSRSSATALDLSVEARWRNGDISDETLNRAELALRSRRALSGGPDSAQSFRNLGRILLLAGRTNEGVEALKASVAALESSPSFDTSALADALDSLALGLIEVALYEEAERYLWRALQIQQTGVVGDRLEMAWTLELLSLVSLRAGRYAEARAPLERALVLRNGRPEHPDTAAASAILGDLLWLEGRPAAARDAYAKCVSISERSLRADHPDVADCTRRLGNAYARLGDMAGALKLLERAADIAERSLGVGHPLLAGYLNDLAETHRTLGDFRVARELYERALAIRERRLGRDHQDVATIVFNLALISSELGDLVEARRQFDRAIAIWRDRLGPDHPFVALAMASLAQALVEHRREGEALPLQRRVLTIRERTLGPNHPETADALGDLASTLLIVGRVPEAAALSKRAMRNWERADMPDSPAFASALVLRANILAGMGDLQGARERYARALVTTEQVFGSDHPSAADLRLRLASVAFEAGQVDYAYEEALTAERARRNFLHATVPYLPEREALTYGLKRPSGLNLILSLAGGALRSQPRNVGSALDAVVRTRGLVLDEMAGRLRFRDGPERQLKSLWTSWVSARQRLANLAVRGEEDRSTSEYLAALHDTRREAEQAERALADRSVDFGARLHKQEIGVAEVQAALPRASALVSFVRYDRAAALVPTHTRRKQSLASYLAFVVGPGSSQPVAIPLGPADRIDSEVDAWRRQATVGLVQSPSPATAELALRHLGVRLRSHIWDPLESHLHGIDRVFVVPDGALNLVPLAALPVGEVGYLLERGPAIHYLSAERDLLQARQPEGVGQGLLALGGPAFDDVSRFAGLPHSGVTKPPSALPTSSENRTRVQEDGAVGALAPFRGSTSECPSFQSLSFVDLPASGDEATKVAGLWDELGPVERQAPTDPKVLIGPAADERSFKQLSPGHRVLHLATHGFFLGTECESSREGTRSVGGLVKRPQAVNQKKPLARVSSPPQDGGTIGENPLLLSGLAMAGANRRAAATADEDDGILTAEEVASLDLSGVEWAVLSACDTGLGEIKAGEGVFGLRRAFQIAGAHTVIMSLWSVEDRAAMTWMRALYEGRLARRLDTAAAVREASLTVLRQRRARGQSTHPFYWAGFVASGDWR
jgi:CHAT domain-containing protein/tetratricopeptide (TPR) repeat protein